MSVSSSNKLSVKNFTSIFQNDDIWITETLLENMKFPIYSFVISNDKMTADILKKMNEYFEKYQKTECYYYVQLSKLLGIDIKILKMQNEMIGKMDKDNRVRMVLFQTKKIVKPFLILGLKGMTIPVSTKVCTKDTKIFDHILKHSSC